MQLMSCKNMKNEENQKMSKDYWIAPLIIIGFGAMLSNVFLDDLKNPTSYALLGITIGAWVIALYLARPRKKDEAKK